ncbi:hypothetical protein SDC9_192422 [bioreactor metagenome]|uniref:Uncharacterized protein n=1 Tax=bioreactor metagenome TaxID=1076179 RepID=A0A645I0P8_9ZZZZ
MRGQARRLRHDGAVDVAHFPARRAHAPQRLGQQHGRIGAAELRVAVGKVRTNVTQRRGAQQRVGDGVQQHVGVGVAKQAQGVRYLHAPQHETAPRHQGVDVPALAYAEIDHSKKLRRKKDCCADRPPPRRARRQSAPACHCACAA